MSSKLLQLPDEELKEKIWSEIGLNKEKIRESVEILKKWMQQQPHLPEDYDDGRLERFLLDSKNSMEKTKTSIDLYYTLKGLCPDLMTGWDTSGEWLRKIQKAIHSYPGWGLTSEGDRICFLTLTEDVDNFDFLYVAKLTIMYSEIRKQEDYWRSDVIIFDLKNFSIAHIQGMTLPVMKKLNVILLKAYKNRIKAVHLLNVPSYAEVIINVVKSILPNKIASRIQIHASDLTELYNLVPKKFLPSDLGGEGDSMAENTERWMREFESKREWFILRENIKSDETKRPGKGVEGGDIFGFDGTFRKLDVD